MQIDTALAFNFLDVFRPGGPWVLTRIRSDRTGIDTMCFDDKDKLKKWLLKFNQSEKENIYFQVNSHCDGLNFRGLKKLSRAHIRSLDYLHVDIDPAAGKSIELEQKRILAILSDPPGNIPKPTFIIFSGGGYQAFWRLNEAFFINGDERLYEEAKLYNLLIENTLEGADACHNVDRIMRLPGTINWPTQRKEAQGRKPVLAKLVANDPVSYDLADFMKATAVQGDQGLAGDSVKISGNVRRLGNVNELGPDVPDNVKALIVQGANAETNTGTTYESDSEAVWYVVCEMVRRSIPDDVIYSVITDPDFGISVHVLKQPRVEKYAIRQIERAHEFAEDPLLMELNESYAIISNMDGGKCRILSKIYDEATEQLTYAFQSFADFKNSLTKRSMIVGKKEVPAAVWWLQHPKGRQYDGIVFSPGSEAPPGYLNLWEGFSCPAIQGNWQLLREHILNNVCLQNQQSFDYLMAWMARGVQHPGEQGHSCIVLRGKEGVGKSFLARQYGALFGCHYLAVSNAKHVVGQFTGHLRNIVFLFGDEAFHVGDKQHESTLKTLITEDRAIYEKKGVDAKASSNNISLMMASNDTWVVPAGLNDRRFLVLDVGEDHIQDSSYFGRIARQMHEGGYSAFLYDLLNLDITDFDVRNVPSTRALEEQKVFSMGPVHQWLYDGLCNGRLLHDKEWGDFHPTDSLVYEARQYGDVKGNSVGWLLSQLGCADRYKRSKIMVRDPLTGREYQKQQAYGYVFHGLADCRRIWKEVIGNAVVPIEFKTLKVGGEEHGEF